MVAGVWPAKACADTNGRISGLLRGAGHRACSANMLIAVAASTDRLPDKNVPAPDQPETRRPPPLRSLHAGADTTVNGRG